MSEIKNYNIIIFDLDGTIVDLNINWEGLRNELKNTFHLPFQPFFQFYDMFNCDTKKKLMKFC